MDRLTDKDIESYITSVVQNIEIGASGKQVIGNVTTEISETQRSNALLLALCQQQQVIIEYARRNEDFRNGWEASQKAQREELAKLWKEEGYLVPQVEGETKSE